MQCREEHLFLGKTKVVSVCTRCGMSFDEIELAKVSEKLQSMTDDNAELAAALRRTEKEELRKTQFIVDRFSRRVDTPTGGTVYVCTECDRERPFHSESCPVGNLFRGR